MIYVQILLVSLGCLFFIVGTLGLLRFDDAYSRIHAITKADNLGLGLLVLGILPSALSVPQGLKLILIWVLVLAASATASYLIAHYIKQHQLSKLPHGARPDTTADGQDAEPDPTNERGPQ
ncbi:MAG: monovalent cation/H(+) antiporter subunit G [Idiomarina sp.]|nr:monovalent cation/H(+) antiporter subunit G [Idiomarina sp.]